MARTIKVPVNTGKTLRKPAAVKTATTATPAPKAPPVAAKPSVPLHKFSSGWTQPSDVTNDRVSRTAIDYNKFGTLTDAALTERDRKALAALREQFANKPFQRANIDAGILRRLGERGFIAHINGAQNEATATFKLTARKAA